MAFDDGWVCRSCWKPNRPGDTRCYRCKTERDADRQTVEARRTELVTAKQRLEARQSSAAGIAGVLPAAVFAWYGRLALIGGVLFLLLTPLVISRPNAPPNTVPLWVGLAIGTIAVGAGMRWASGAMRVANPWGFVAGLVISVGFAAFTIYALGTLPVGVGNPNWMRYVSIGVFGLSAILALVGLLYSLREDPVAEW